MRALVVGGGTGLGLASAEALAASGRVFLTGRREDVLAGAAAAIGSACAGWRAGDATVEADVEAVVAAAREALGGIDALVVSSGASGAGTVVTSSLSEFRRILDANVLPPFLFARGVAPLMTEGGAIVVIASIAGSVPHAERVAYCTAKAGAIGMVRQMALDLAPMGIRVNAVSPSLVLTDLSRRSIAETPDPEATLAARLGRHPLGRLGTTGEVGAAVAWLASDAAFWVTGQDFQMDGGLALRAAAAPPG